MAPRKSTTKAKAEKEAPKATKPESPKAAKQAPTPKKIAPAKVEPKTRRTPGPEAKAKPAKEAKKPLPMPEPAKSESKKPKSKVQETKPATAEVSEAPQSSVATAPKLVGSNELLTPHASAILLAIREGRAVELIFKESDANPPRTFEPRQLTFDTFTQAWFVWGWDRRYNAERYHRVDLFAEVNAVEGPGRAAQGPFKEGTPANHIGGWLGGEPIPVKVLLMKQWIFAVKQAPAPFPNFKIEDVEEGKAQITFTGTDLRAIARWCMQFGDGIQVLEPQRLQDRLKQVGIAWGGKAAAQPTPAPSKPEPRSEPRPEPRPEQKAQPRPEPRHEPRNEPRQQERRPEYRPEPRPEPRREFEETKADKPKSGKVEVRIERL